MKNITLHLLPIAFGSACFAQERHEHQAHTHGLAEMTVVYENHQLIINLETPVTNILGFEHESHTEEEAAAIARAWKLVNDPSTLFNINPNCGVINVDVDFPYEQGLVSHEAHHEDDHDSEDHHEDHSHEHELHEDINLAYEWNCEKSAAPGIQVQVFDLFPGFESIQSQWIVNGKQGLTRLNKKSSELDFDE